MMSNNSSSESAFFSSPSHLEVHPTPHRNIVASPEPGSESGSPRSSSSLPTTPNQPRSLSIPPLSNLQMSLLPSPMAKQLSGKERIDTEMSPAPAVTSLDEMDEGSVILASTDSSASNDNDSISDDDNDYGGNIHNSRNQSNQHHSKQADLHLKLELKNSGKSTQAAVPIPNTATSQDEENHTARLAYDPKAGFSIGFAEDRNNKYRKDMEDAHAFISNFQDIQGQGYFAVFDGHAGKGVAEWCGQHLHETLQNLLNHSSHIPIPEILNKLFVSADRELAGRPEMQSGCTAAVALLRVEHINPTDSREMDVTMYDETSKKVHGQPTVPKRVLYTANAGDARIVVCRNGVATRLSYDHKASDASEQQRIFEAGGFVLKNRVNGILAVTRSLGDATMKEWVIGNPYTAETLLTSTDSFFIVACDGLWDVCTDQAAVDLVANIEDPQQAAEELLIYALEQCSMDNLSIMVVRLDQNWTYDADHVAKAIITKSELSGKGK